MTLLIYFFYISLQCNFNKILYDIRINLFVKLSQLKNYSQNNQQNQNSFQYQYQQPISRFQNMSIPKSKKIKTQKSITNPFDESIQLVILSKLEKCYQNLSQGIKNNYIKGDFQFENIKLATKYLQKDLQILRHNKKDKRKIHSLIVTLDILILVKESLYQKALQQIQKQISLFQKYSDNSDSIIQIKNTLIKSLILKKLKKEQESTQLIKKAIQNIQVRLPKKPISKHHNKIIQLNLLSIAMIAEEFFSLHLQNESYEIYKEAYQISNKYLTQYHKITETLQSILKKIKPQQKIKSSSKPKTIRSKRLSLGKSLRYDNASLKHKTLQSQSIILQQTHYKIRNNRLKTIQQGLSKSIKQQQFSRIYGEQNERKCWTKLYKNQTSTLTSKINSSFLNSQITYKDQSSQMKQLQKIKQMYLPKIQPKKSKRKSRKVYYEKKNIVDVIITTSKMDTLRPQYFNNRSQNDKQQNAISSLSQSLILKNEAIRKAMQTQTIQIKHQKKEFFHLQNIDLKKDDININSKIRSEPQIKAKEDAGCQLI